MSPHELFVHDVLARYLEVEPDDVATEDHLARDIGFDDLDLILVALEIEDTFASEFPMASLEGVTTVGSLVDLVRTWRLGDAQPMARAS